MLLRGISLIAPLIFKKNVFASRSYQQKQTYQVINFHMYFATPAISQCFVLIFLRKASLIQTVP